jgi:hypothetical protein
MNILKSLVLSPTVATQVNARLRAERLERCSTEPRAHQPAVAKPQHLRAEDASFDMLIMQHLLKQKRSSGFTPTSQA